MFWEVLTVILASASPVSELRGGIPLGLAMSLAPGLVIPLAFIVNCLTFFPIYFGLEFLYEKWFSRYNWAKKLIDRVHRKVYPYIKRYGIFGLVVFVAIPLPITGAWTGTAAAWVLGLNWKKSFLAICIGVFIAAVIISFISLGFLGLVNGV